MNATSKGMVFAAAGLALALPIVRARAQTASAGPAQQTPTGPEAKKAEQVYKNIQALKGIPADQVFPAMLFITASLGVQCATATWSAPLRKTISRPNRRRGR